MKRLMIVEDEKMIRQGISVIVKRSGIFIGEIIECKNGVEALEVAQTQKVDVVITDIRMPKMDGITLVKKLSQLEVMPKVIVISGYDDFSYAVELLRYGAKEYLLKPIEREVLIAVLERLEEEIIGEQLETQKIHIDKYFKLFLENPSEENFETFKRYAVEWVDKKNYWVYCSNHQAKKYFEVDGTIYIENIKEQDFWIVSDEEGKLQLEAFLEEACYGASKAYQEVDRFREAYNEAIKSRKTAFFKTKCHKEISRSLEDDLQREVIGIDNRITQLVGTERFEEAIKLLEVLQCKVERSKISQTYFEEMMYRLWNQINTTYKQILNLEECTYMSLGNIYKYNNVRDYIKVFSEFLLKLHHKISNSVDDHKNIQKMQQAIDYINENYTKDINMATVSNHISMNYSLFSLLFKEYTGMNFVNYIKELRISEAKRLLIHTDKKINEISILVGYENEKHFMKVFKALYCVSPTEYRRNARVGKNCKKVDTECV